VTGRSGLCSHFANSFYSFRHRLHLFAALSKLFIVIFVLQPSNFANALKMIEKNPQWGIRLVFCSFGSRWQSGSEISFGLNSL